MRSWKIIWQIDASVSWAIILDDDFYILRIYYLINQNIKSSYIAFDKILNFTCSSTIQFDVLIFIINQSSFNNVANFNFNIVANRFSSRFDSRYYQAINLRFCRSRTTIHRRRWRFHTNLNIRVETTLKKKEK